MNKAMKHRSPQSDKLNNSIIVWKPQFPVSRDFVLHSFHQSIKIILDSATNSIGTVANVD